MIGYVVPNTSRNYFWMGGRGGQAAKPIKNDGYRPKSFKNVVTAPQIGKKTRFWPNWDAPKMTKRLKNPTEELKPHNPQAMNCPKVQLPP